MNDLISVPQKNASVYYRVALKSFFDSDADGIGDLRGMLAKIPYYLFLGVDHVVLTDVAEADRYGVTDYFRVDPEVGSMEDFDELVGAMHSANLKVYLSLPFQYTSSANAWFTKSAQSADLNPYREYYLWQTGKDAKGKTSPDDRKTAAKEPVWTCAKNNVWYYSEFGGDRPALNYDNPRLRKEMIDALRFWREKGVDGFVLENTRLSIRKESIGTTYTNPAEVFETGAPFYRFLRDAEEQFAHEFPILLDSDAIDIDLYPYLLSEGSPLVGGILSDQPINELETKSFSFGRFLKKYLSVQEVASKYSITISFGDTRHDRLLSKIARPADGASAAKMLGALLLCAAPAPILYQGEEIGMTDLPKKVADKATTPFPNARASFHWDNKTNAGFTLAPYSVPPINENYREINCAAEWSDTDSPLTFYRKMIAFRKASPALIDGDFVDHSSGDVIAFTRKSDTETLLILANTLSRHLNYAVPETLPLKGAECLISSYSLVGKTLHPSIGLRPYEVRIYRLSI